MTANSKDVSNLNPTTDFYKKLALECAGEQVAIDLFILAGQHCDLGSMCKSLVKNFACLLEFFNFFMRLICIMSLSICTKTYSCVMCKYLQIIMSEIHRNCMKPINNWG